MLFFKQMKIILMSTSVTLHQTLHYICQNDPLDQIVLLISTDDCVQHLCKFLITCVKQSHYIFSMCYNISQHNVCKHTEMCLLFHVLCYRIVIFILRYIVELSVTRLKRFGVHLACPNGSFHLWHATSFNS